MDIDVFYAPVNMIGLEKVATKALLQRITSKYQLSVFGIHGVSHWARVLENGLRLSAITGANAKIVILFAVFHDSKRQNEGRDDGHGRRGAKFVTEIESKLLALSENEIALLREACDLHTDGLVEGDVTLQTCWDSDRLDLNRVGIKTNPKQLCTSTAKDSGVIEWAMQRAEEMLVPDFVDNLWGFK